MQSMNPTHSSSARSPRRAVSTIVLRRHAGLRDVAARAAAARG
jgi:hypothetical protein